MSLLALGINHKTASVEVREKVAFAPAQLADALQQGCEYAQLKGLAILSTCNRTELYCEAELLDEARLLDWLSHYHGVALSELQQCSYIHRDAKAVQHTMRVAGGLDSLVLGEPQILGQMKSAYALSQQQGVLGGDLNQLFQQTFATAKQIRTETAIGQNPVSVAYAAVSMAQHIFSDLRDSKALLIGAGETIELVAKHLDNAGIGGLIVANRTLDRALALAEQFDGQAVLLGDIPEVLPKADIVIASTASQLPILGKGAVESALKKRRYQPVFMVDIAVPRDIEPQVDDLDDVYLYTVDDLQEVIEENQRSRESAAREAEDIVRHNSDAFMASLRSREAVSTLTGIREQAEQLRDAEVDNALRQLAKGVDTDKVVAELARRLTNKMLHHPTIQLRKASAEGRTELIDAAAELYQLPEWETK